MEKEIEVYLAAVERHLRALGTSERIDIISEIKSHIQEKKLDQQFTTQQILSDLGSPRALARGYVGETVSKRDRTSFSQAMRLAAFYGVTGLHGSFVVPTLAITAWALYFCTGVICVAAVLRVLADFLHINLPFMLFNFGSWSPPTFVAVPLALVIAWLCYIGGRKLWALLKRYISKVSEQHQSLKSDE